jgi:hypothetical protein
MTDTTKRPLLLRPATPYVTSIGALAIQFFGYLLSAPLEDSDDFGQIVFGVSQIILLVVPLVSIFGIVSAIRLFNKKKLLLSLLPLALNSIYLLFWLALVGSAVVIGGH